MPQPKLPVPLTAPQTPTSESLIAKLREENAVLTARITEARDTINGYRKQLDAQNRATFRHSRLTRLLEALEIPLPQTDDEYISAEFMDRAKEAIASRADIKVAHAERDVALHSIKLLLGASEVTVNKRDKEEGHVVTFVLKNDELDREMSFNISWDDNKIEYNRISVRVEQAAAPQFADEHCIVFDFPQGPFFLAEVLSAVHDAQVEGGKEVS